MTETLIRRVWVTRAQPGADRTAERLDRLGLTPLVSPLIEIRPLDVRPDLTGIEALAFTSRNGVAAFAALTHDRSLPVLAVGDTTAASAREAGFTDVRSAGGDLYALAALIRADGAGQSILQLSAVEPAGDLAALVGDAARITALPVYEALETDMVAPDGWDAILIHSPRAARAVAARLPSGAANGRIAIAISAAAAAPLAPLGFTEIRIVETPTETSLLAALGKREANV